MQLHTLKSWGKEEIIGFEADGNNMVAVWCKLCSKHIEKINADNTLKDKAKEDALNYTKKVTFVKKVKIDRYFAKQVTNLPYLMRASPPSKMSMATHQNEGK